MQIGKAGRECVFSVLQSVLLCFRFMIPEGSSSLIEPYLVAHVTVFHLLPTCKILLFPGDYLDSCHLTSCASGGVLLEGPDLPSVWRILHLHSSNDAEILLSPWCRVSPPLMLISLFGKWGQLRWLTAVVIGEQNVVSLASSICQLCDLP